MVGKQLSTVNTHSLDNNDLELTTMWLYSQRVSFIIAIQDGVITTKIYKKYKQEINLSDYTCRMCHLKLKNLTHHSRMQFYSIHLASFVKEWWEIICIITIDKLRCTDIDNKGEET